MPSLICNALGPEILSGHNLANNSLDIVERVLRIFSNLVLCSLANKLLTITSERYP